MQELQYNLNKMTFVTYYQNRVFALLQFGCRPHRCLQRQHTDSWRLLSHWCQASSHPKKSQSHQRTSGRGQQNGLCLPMNLNCTPRYWWTPKSPRLRHTNHYPWTSDGWHPMSLAVHIESQPRVNTFNNVVCIFWFHGPSELFYRSHFFIFPEFLP